MKLISRFVVLALSLVFAGAAPAADVVVVNNTGNLLVEVIAKNKIPGFGLDDNRLPPETVVLPGAKYTIALDNEDQRDARFCMYDMKVRMPNGGIFIRMNIYTCGKGKLLWTLYGGADTLVRQ